MHVLKIVRRHAWILAYSCFVLAAIVRIPLMTGVVLKSVKRLEKKVTPNPEYWFTSLRGSCVVLAAIVNLTVADSF